MRQTTYLNKISPKAKLTVLVRISEAVSILFFKVEIKVFSVKCVDLSKCGIFFKRVINISKALHLVQSERVNE